VPRRCRQGTKDGDRIHASGILVTVPYSDFLVVAVSVGDRQPVGEKDQVELSALKGACDINVIARGEKRHLMCRVPPERMTMRNRACNQKTSEIHVPGGHCGDSNSKGS
jgi:hypothetical protein